MDGVFFLWQPRTEVPKTWVSSLVLSPLCSRLLGIPLGEIAVKMLGSVASKVLREQ